MPASRRRIASCQTLVTKGAQEREHRVPHDGEHERAHAAKPVADRTPQKRESPADQKQSKRQRPVVADVALVGDDAGVRQQLAQRRYEHERVDHRVHTVERPAAPRGPEAANLISCEGLQKEVRFASGQG